MNTLTSFSVVSLGLNWVDILTLIIITVYGVEGYFMGFFAAVVDFVSFVLSFVFGLTLYTVVANPLVHFLHIPQGFANAIGFLVIAIFSEVVFNVALRKLIVHLPLFIKADSTKHKIIFAEKIAGVFPGVMSGVVLCSFILSLILALPFSVFLKHAVTNSKVGSVLVANTQVFAKSLNDVFGKAANDSLSFLTVEPQSNQSVSLNFKISNVSIDRSSEQQMFNSLNYERTSRGLKALDFSPALTKAGEAHCKDMFVRGYFSHYTPQGLSPFDRMIQQDIPFNFAGENLALAPNTDLAMKGLMQSEGHKANILSINFAKVGVGVIDGGIYGEMFCQEFTD